MKYIGAIVIILFSFLSYSSSYSKKECIVTSNALNVRECPKTDCNIVGKFNKGDTVNVLEVKGEWAKISFSSTEGFVSLKYLKEIGKPVPSYSFNSKYETLIFWTEKTIKPFIVFLVLQILYHIYIFRKQ